MTIYLASDHAGFRFKKKIKLFLEKSGRKVKDLGPFSFNPEDDYPDFVKLAAKAVSKNPKDLAVVLGGSGQGEAIVANRYKNVRAAVYYGGSKEILKLSRRHNDANVLSLGARFLNEKEVLAAVKLWLGAKFSGEARHRRRIAKIDK